MSLKIKVAFTYFLFILSLILLTFFVTQFAVKKTVDTIEEKYIVEDIERLKKCFELEKSNLLGLAKDWAAWTDAWLFMQGKNPKFVKSNLTLESFINNKIIFLAYFDLKGGLKEGFEYNRESRQLIRADENFWAKFLQKYLSSYDKPDFRKEGFIGISFKNENPILVAIYPVLKSDFSGPISGYLVMASSITKEKQDLMRDIFIFSELRIEPINGTKEFLKNSPIIKQNGKKYEVYLELEDFLGNHNIAVKLQRERKLWDIVQDNLFKLIIFYFSFSFFFGLFFYAWLNRNVINRIKKLIKDIDDVKNGKIDQITMVSKDEIGYLSGEINTYIITVKKQIDEIEANRKLYEAIAEKSEAIIFLFDKNGKILFANSNAYEILNKEGSETPSEDLFHLLSEIIKMNKEEKTFLSEFKLKSGLFISGWIIPIEEKENILFIAHDITHLKKEKEKLFEIAIKDSLTSLYNRVYFESTLRRLFGNVTHGETYCLLFIDLDDLKLINDKFGHIIGDELIKETANSIRKSIREDDLAARWGGDEFVVIIKGNLDIAQKIGERIQKNLQEISFNFLPETIKPTVSIGITPIDASKDIETIIREADKAAYDAKRGGKNRVKIFDSQE
ncbi:MAG: diguanylate cyclase [Thermodesulfovibrio sp.]|nr:diguanylate cyclase [Thermodesulfovibrio sp.]